MNTELTQAKQFVAVNFMDFNDKSHEMLYKITSKFFTGVLRLKDNCITIEGDGSPVDLLGFLKKAEDEFYKFCDERDINEDAPKGFYFYF